MKRLHRVVSIALLLSARRRLKAEELAEHFGISLRTVYRDVAALAEAGFPIQGTPGDGYTLPSDAQLKPLQLSEEEAEALVLGARLLLRGADPGLAERIRDATAKLEAGLSRGTQRRLKRHRDTVVLEPAGDPPAVPEGPLSVLLSAIQDRQVLRVAYDGLARGERTERELEPLGIVRLGAHWVVAAYCRLRRDLRAFRLDRIARALPTGETYVDRPGFTLEDVRKREEVRGG